ncbi:MAG TPA: hypothetical protein GX506_05155 [Firmicutes bacterium]|nr:hypothetical protein [Bacillota bacterium]
MQDKNGQGKNAQGKNVMVTTVAIVAMIIALVSIVAYMAKTNARISRELQALRKERQELTRRVDRLEGRLKEVEKESLSLIPAQVTLYFARVTATDTFLEPVKETTRARGSADVPRAALEALAKGPPPGSGLEPTLPPGTKILGVTVKDGTAVADFSREIRTQFPGGSRAEEILVYSVVNTLTDLPGIKRVQFLVEGKKVETIGGHMGIMEPLTRNERLVRR